ncbi:uncharacterized protein [Littorina saxatilis]|uniref:Uncharacterized protein n=1 Tax=Littorina saxatilis TaxID=31220 RepID=A0AAN9BF63_9CAEN
MESTTTAYLFQGNDSDDGSHHFIDDTNKTAYLAAGGTLIVLTFLLNVAVIAVIVYLYVKRPTVTSKSPHFIPMLACCVAEILEGVFDSAFSNMLRVRQYEGSFGLSCREWIALDLSYGILSTLPLLLVAAVIFTQAVRLQRVVTLTGVVQKVVAVVVVVLSVVYVVVVVIAVFYMTFMEDNTKVCKEVRGKEHANYQWKLSKRRVLHAVDYIVPSLYILLSSAVLLLAHFVLKNRTTDTVTLVSTNTHSPGSTATPRFPFNVLLAAASCIILYFVFFLYLFKGSWSGLTLSRMWLAGRMLEKLNGVFLPCFWLLDADIRALWCCCGNKSRAPPEVVTLESSEGRRMEDGGDDMNGTRF